MKNIAIYSLLCAALFMLAACGNKSQNAPEVTAAFAPTDNETVQESTPVQAAQPTEEETADDGQQALVAYFSATGTTKSVAETIASAVGGKLYEITPAQPYTRDDLNYNDNKSRTTTEQNDSTLRPAISGSVEGFENYDVVFVGFPIWWYEEPRIIDTFMENYDWNGKTVIPFCTSGGSGLGSAPAHMEALTTGATFLSGQRFRSSVSVADVQSWVRDLGLNLG